MKVLIATFGLLALAVLVNSQSTEQTAASCPPAIEESAKQVWNACIPRFPDGIPSPKPDSGSQDRGSELRACIIKKYQDDPNLSAFAAACPVKTGEDDRNRLHCIMKEFSKTCPNHPHGGHHGGQPGGQHGGQPGGQSGGPKRDKRHTGGRGHHKSNSTAAP